MASALKRLGFCLGFWSVTPLILPQALYVRLTAPRFAPAGGPEEGQFAINTDTAEPLRMVAIGDSIIAGVGAQTLRGALVGQTAAALAHRCERPVNWIARGEIGLASDSILDRLVADLPEQADIVLVSTGVNDVTGLKSEPRWRRDLQRLLGELRHRNPRALLVMAGVPPLSSFPLLPQPLRSWLGARSRLFDQIARAIIADTPNALYAPLDVHPTPDLFAADGFHPGESGYQMFGDMIASLIAEHHPQFIAEARSTVSGGGCDDKTSVAS